MLSQIGARLKADFLLELERVPGKRRNRHTRELCTLLHALDPGKSCRGLMTKHCVTICHLHFLRACHFVSLEVFHSQGRDILGCGYHRAGGWADNILEVFQHASTTFAGPSCLEE